MWTSNKYDLSGSSYTQMMDEKTTQYNNLMRKAERTNHEMEGKPTKEEATYYFQAAKVCEQIINLNLSQRAVYTQWQQRKLDCEAQVRRISAILAPPPPPEPKPEPEKKQKNPQPAGKSTKSPAAEQVKVTSASGFTTEHASREVPVEMIEKWFRDDVPENGFESVIGRDELKDRLLLEAASFGWTKVDEALQINPVQCYFLYGPPGSGKGHLIDGFAGELKKKGFNFMQLVGSQVHSGYVGDAEKIVATAFNVAMEHEPCLLFMDEIDNLCVRRGGKEESHERRLTISFLESYNKFKRSGKRVIFMGATNCPGKVDAAMLDRISLIKIPLPAEEDRVVYFEKISQWLEEGLTPQEMAEATDNYSYRDLDRLRDGMLFKLKTQAIKEFSVLDEQGKVDMEVSDEKASQAIMNNQVLITRELFNKFQKENPPSDKSHIMEELKEFEDKVAQANQ